jgi:hypothetical protein
VVTGCPLIGWTRVLGLTLRAFGRPATITLGDRIYQAVEASAVIEPRAAEYRSLQWIVDLQLFREAKILIAKRRRSRLMSAPGVDLLFRAAAPASCTFQRYAGPVRRHWH